MRLEEVDGVTLVTLVGKRQARVGSEFVYMGRSTKCIECELRKVCCDKLESGRVYSVVAVRDKLHDCPIHEDGVQLVEVEEAPATVTLPSHQLFEGAVFSFHPVPCNEWQCPHNRACNPDGLKEADRCRVEKVLQKGGLDCSRKQKLGLAAVRRVS
jgi:uncharacterized protein (UPF0179 family)